MHEIGRADACKKCESLKVITFKASSASFLSFVFSLINNTNGFLIISFNVFFSYLLIPLSFLRAIRTIIHWFLFWTSFFKSSSLTRHLSCFNSVIKGMFWASISSWDCFSILLQTCSLNFECASFPNPSNRWRRGGKTLLTGARRSKGKDYPPPLMQKMHLH